MNYAEYDWASVLVLFFKLFFCSSTKPGYFLPGDIGYILLLHATMALRTLTVRYVIFGWLTGATCPLRNPGCKSYTFLGIMFMYQLSRKVV